MEYDWEEKQYERFANHLNKMIPKNGKFGIFAFAIVNNQTGEACFKLLDEDVDFDMFEMDVMSDIQIDVEETFKKVQEGYMGKYESNGTKTIPETKEGKEG